MNDIAIFVCPACANRLALPVEPGFAAYQVHCSCGAVINVQVTHTASDQPWPYPASTGKCKCGAALDDHGWQGDRTVACPQAPGEQYADF